jgi:pSer/pThr/pTyr-binding forkhead associated (FHA) protein
MPDPAVAAGDVAVAAVRVTSAPDRTADPGLALVRAEDADAARGGATLVYRPPRPIGPLARLRVRERDGTTREVVVGGQGLSIGRAPDNDLVLADPRVSRRHARLVVRFGGLVLVDTESRNGVAVNGQAIREIALGVGDEIRIGDALLVVEAP